MRFRMGLLIGAGVGYVLGAKAGRERYEQILALRERLRSNDNVQKIATTAEKATRTPRAAVGESLVKAAETTRRNGAARNT